MAVVAALFSHPAKIGRRLTGSGFRDDGLRKALSLRKLLMLPVLAIPLVGCTSAPYSLRGGEVTMVRTDYGRFHVQKDRKKASEWGARLSMLDEIPSAENLKLGGVDAIERVSDCRVTPNEAVVVNEYCRRIFGSDPVIYAEVMCD